MAWDSSLRGCDSTLKRVTYGFTIEEGGGVSILMAPYIAEEDGILLTSCVLLFY